jgi:hypothetical protein
MDKKMFEFDRKDAKKIISKHSCVGVRQIANILQNPKMTFRANALFLYAYALEKDLTAKELKKLIDAFVASKKVLKERL